MNCQIRKKKKKKKNKCRHGRLLNFLPSMQSVTCICSSCLEPQVRTHVSRKRPGMNRSSSQNITKWIVFFNIFLYILER